MSRPAHARCGIIDLQIDRLLMLCPPPEDRIPDIDPDNHAGDIEKVAAMTRARMGVPPGPVENLVDTIETCGGIVIDRDLEIDNLNALCRWVPGLPKLFFLNGARPGDRMRLTLAHELGHTVMHFNRDADQALAEDQAQRFAAAFLLPASEIRRDLGVRLDIPKLSALKRKWRVSMQALAYRAHQLGCIDRTRYTSIFQQLSRLGWRKTEPVEVQRESPRAFKRLLRAHRHGLYARATHGHAFCQYRRIEGVACRRKLAGLARHWRKNAYRALSSIRAPSRKGPCVRPRGSAPVM